MDAVSLIRKALVVILAFLVFLELPILVGAWAAKDTLLDENFYLKELSRREIYSLAKDQAISMASGLDAGEAITKDEQMALAGKLADAVPNSYLDSQARVLLGNMLGYLKGQKSELSLELDLTSVRPALSKTATDFLLLQMKDKYSGADFAIPPMPGVPVACTNLISCIEYCRDSSHTQECDTFLEASGLLSAPGAPPELATVFGSGQGFSGIDSLVQEKIPEKVVLTGYIDAQAMKSINEIRDAIATINSAILWGFLLVLAQLFLIALIEFDVWKGAKKISATLFSCSFSIAVPALITYFLLPNLVSSSVPLQMMQMPLVSATTLIAIDLGQEISVKTILSAALVFIIAGALFLAARFLPQKFQKKEETVNNIQTKPLPDEPKPKQKGKSK